MAGLQPSGLAFRRLKLWLLPKDEYPTALSGLCSCAEIRLVSLLPWDHQSCRLLLAHPMNVGHVASSVCTSTSTSTSTSVCVCPGVHACVLVHACLYVGVCGCVCTRVCFCVHYFGTSGWCSFLCRFPILACHVMYVTTTTMSVEDVSLSAGQLPRLFCTGSTPQRVMCGAMGW